MPSKVAAPAGRSTKEPRLAGLLLLGKAFLAEQDPPERRVKVQPAQTLPASYVEAVLLGEAGEPTSTKRILSRSCSCWESVSSIAARLGAGTVAPFDF